MIYTIVAIILCGVATRLVYKRWIQLHINDLVALRERLLQMDGKDHYIQEIDELLLSKKYI
eukprot:SAG11_NODE_6882_length_1231_cov_131.461131_2_plen_61_part_00